MVTNMISQLQGSFPLRRAAGFVWNLINLTGDVLDELPNFHIDTFSELEEHSGRFAEVSESDVEKLIEGEENAKTENKDLLWLVFHQYL